MTLALSGFPPTSRRRIDHRLREPVIAADLTLSASASGAFADSLTADGGDFVYALLKIDNSSGTSPLYDASYTLTLPTGVSFVGVETAPSAGTIGTGSSTVEWTGIPEVAKGGSLTALVRLQLAAGIAIGDTLDLDISAMGDSLEEDTGTDDREYTLTESDAATVTIQSLSLSGGIDSTSVASTTFTSTTALTVIGEQVVYEYDVILPVGTASDLKFEITIPDGFEILYPSAVGDGRGRPQWIHHSGIHGWWFTSIIPSGCDVWGCDPDC